MVDALDGAYAAPIPPDQQPTLAKAAASASQKTADTFVLEKSGLNVVANGGYAFAFAYKYLDPNNPSSFILGPRSANFRFTLQAPDYTVAVQNLVVTPGLLSYGVKWDAIDKSISANKWFIDAQIYESLTGAFTGEEYLVWNGTGNSATILVSDTNNRWIRVDTRDQDYHKKSVKYGPFKATDPITVDTVGPANVTSVTATSGIDTSGYLGFNAYADISWPAVTGGGIRGYRIRFSNDNNVTYSYVDSPGTGTTYRLGGLAIGSTYKIAVATYDEFNNTSSSYISGPDVTVSGTPSVSSYISGGPFQFGVGVGGTSTNKGLYFDASNYWYVNASNSARLKVGGSTSNYLLWDGSTFAIDGNITARGGTFSGNILMSTSGASIYNGTIDSVTGNLTGNGFALNSTGLKVANGTKSVTISAATGTITANGGTIAGWTLGDTTLSKNNVILDSAGQIQLGASAAASIYLKSSGSYVMWAGNNTPDANAKFRVGSDGTLYATGATITGNITANAIALGTTYNGTSMTTIQSNAATGSTALQPNGTLTGNVSGKVGGVDVATVTSGAASGSSAIQPGNGVTVDATTKRINKIQAAAGLPIQAGTTYPVYMDGTGLYMKNPAGQDSIFLDASSGSAVFRGTIYAGAGEFTGKITAGSGSIGGWNINATSGVLQNTGASTILYPGTDPYAIITDRSIAITRQIQTGSGGLGIQGATNFIIFQGGLAPGNTYNTQGPTANDQAYNLGYSTDRWGTLYVGSVNQLSDVREKTDIGNTSLGLNFIKKLRPVEFKFKMGKNVTTRDPETGDWSSIKYPGIRKHHGFIAQEVKQVLDEISDIPDMEFAAWKLDDKDNPESQQQLEYTEFIAPMTKAIQELANMVESLQEEVNTLKGI